MTASASDPVQLDTEKMLLGHQHGQAKKMLQRFSYRAHHDQRRNQAFVIAMSKIKLKAAIPVIRRS